MLPSFRLIAMTFLCGFMLVYASLRFVAPGMASPPDWRQPDLAVPVIFEARFAPSEGVPSPVPVSVARHAMGRAADLIPGLAPDPVLDLIPAAVTAALSPPLDEPEAPAAGPAAREPAPLPDAEPGAPLVEPRETDPDTEPAAIALAPAAATPRVVNRPRRIVRPRQSRPAQARPAAARRTPPAATQPVQPARPATPAAPTNPFEALFGRAP